VLQVDSIVHVQDLKHTLWCNVHFGVQFATFHTWGNKIYMLLLSLGVLSDQQTPPPVSPLTTLTHTHTQPTHTFIHTHTFTRTHAWTYTNMLHKIAQMQSHTLAHIPYTHTNANIQELHSPLQTAWTGFDTEEEEVMKTIVMQSVNFNFQQYESA